MRKDECMSAAECIGKCITRRNWGGGEGEKDGRTHKEKKKEKGKWLEEWRKIEIQMKGVNLRCGISWYRGGGSWMIL
jgi:hypothetical protein